MWFSSAFRNSPFSSLPTSPVISSDSHAAAPDDRRSDRSLGRGEHIRFAILVLAMLCLAVLGGSAPSAEAQTAHFSGAVIPLASGNFNHPSGVAVDGSGNVFVADYGNNRVVEILAVNGGIPANPTINTLGSGFNQPSGVAVDGSGNVFVADSQNNRVVEILAVNGSIPANPTINTLGSGFSNPSGVAVDGSGNVFVADYDNSAIKEILFAGGYNTVNTLASANGNFSHPSGVAVDGGGNVFVADQSNSAIKEILFANGYTNVNTLGSGFTYPSGVAVDGSGNVFVADSFGNAVKEILAAGGYTTVNTLANGNFTQPNGVAVDRSGNVFVGDYGNNAVKELMTQGVNFGSAAIATSTPVTLSLNFTFDSPGTIAAPAVLTQGAANLDFTDAGTGSCTTNGTSYTYNAGDTCTVNVKFSPKFSGVRYGAATLANSLGVVIATAYVHGTGIGPQVTFSPATSTTLSSNFNLPQSVAVDGSGNVFVADYYNNAVKEILAAGGYTNVTTLGSGFSYPSSVAVDGSGNVFVADQGNNAVKEILAAGGYATVNTLGSGFSSPLGVAVDGGGNVFVGDYNGVKEMLAADGYATVHTLRSGFNIPIGLAVDGSGNVFVADYYNNAVKEMLAVDGYTTVHTLGRGFSYPHGVAVDGSGNVFVADNGHGAVKEILAAGGYSTVNTLSSSGRIYPGGVAVDGSGNVFVADNGLSVVRKMDFTDPPSLSFAPTAIGSTSSDSPRAVTLTNIGNAPLSISSIVSDNTGFTQDAGSTTCSTSATVAAGNTCNVGVVFTPQVPGTVTGHLTITDNAPAAGSAQAVTLSGIATPASFAVTLVPASVTAGTSVQATVTALGASGNMLTGFSGTANLTFTSDVSSSTFPATVTLINGMGNFTFAPTTLTSSGSVRVSYANVTSTANFAVTAAAATQIVVSPATVSAVGSMPFSITATEEDAYGNLVPATLSVAIAPGGGATASGPVSIASGIGATFTPNSTAGQYMITFSNGSLSATTTVTSTLADSFVVETLGDPNAGNYYGTASNCVNQTTGSSYQTGATTNANCSLRDAVAAANGTSGASITFDPAVVSKANPGTIVLGEELEAGSSMMITGPGSAALTLDGSHAERDGIWDFESDQASIVSGMTLLNSDYEAIYNDGGSIAINDVTVTYNGAPLDRTPRGVLGLYGTATVSNSSFLNVPSVSSGAAVFLYNDGSVSNTQFRNISGTPLVTGYDANWNNVSYTNSVSYSVFDLNNTSNGINNSGLAGVLVSYSSNLTVTGSTFSNNTATKGSGIDLEKGNATVSNSTFSGNASTDTGAGSTVFNNGTGALTILDSTLSGNTDAAGREVAIANGATVTVQNSIVAANNGSATSTGNCTGCTLAGSNVIDVDPKLLPLGSYGSATPQTPALQTMLPLPNSPAVCAGAATADSTDERGYPRTTVNGTSSCYDIGAVQTAYTLAFTQQPTDTLVLSTITPGPEVQLSEHGAYFPGVSVTIGVSSGTLSGTTAQTTDSTGTASFSNLSPNTATSETLTATVGTLSATSNSFNVAGITPAITFTVPSHTYGDAPFTVSATSTSTGAFTYTVVSGPATVSGSTVTLTGTGTVVLQASQAADSNYIASTKNATFAVTTIPPTIIFTVPSHTFGDSPFTVSATSNSTGAFTYSVVSGPATVSGATVTLTGSGTVVLQASQAASGNYAPATATASFTVAVGLTLSSGNSSGTATVTPGAVATFTLTFSPTGAATFPDMATFSATGLPTGATATFSPANVAAGSAATQVTLTIQTSSQTARNEKSFSGGPFAPVALGLLLLPFTSMKTVRRRLRQMPRLTVALAVTVLSLGALLGLSGCAGKGAANQTAKSYTVVVTATDVTTGAHTSTNLTLTVQ